MIKTFLIGRLCADPELRTTTNGHTVCNLRLAVRTSVKDENGQWITDFYNATTWNGLADNCAKFLKKGNLVYITGEPRKREYTGNDGTKHVEPQINVESLEFGPSGSGGSAQSRDSAAPAQSASSVSAADVADDLPF